MRKGKIICVDIETTGLDMANDEILQISIINGRGKTLYNSYIRPEHKREWKEAEEINKIGWEAVQGKVAAYMPPMPFSTTCKNK